MFYVEAEVPHVSLPVMIQEDVAPDLLVTSTGPLKVTGDIALYSWQCVVLPRHLPQRDLQQVVQHLHVGVLVSLPAEEMIEQQFFTFQSLTRKESADSGRLC